jgi:hypothetical protein
MELTDRKWSAFTGRPATTPDPMQSGSLRGMAPIGGWKIRVNPIRDEEPDGAAGQAAGASGVHFTKRDPASSVPIRNSICLVEEILEEPSDHLGPCGKVRLQLAASVQLFDHGAGKP